MTGMLLVQTPAPTPPVIVPPSAEDAKTPVRIEPARPPTPWTPKASSESS